MTFNFAPYAIDGARTTSALARLAAYTTGGGRSGVAKPDSLKVLPLAAPGNGLRITAGGATILNRYQASPDQVYVVSNPGTHTVPAASMPAPNPQLAHYLVCVVVGDTEFNQTGHPFMPTTLAPGSASTFEYVRVVLIPCAANTTSFDQLGLSYPAIALARLEIPPNTTTITSAMITNLRTLAQPRQDRQIFMNTVPPNRNLGSNSYFTWPGYTPNVEIPPWATRAMMTVQLSGIVAYDGETHGNLRAAIGTLVGAGMSYDVDTVNGGRYSFMMAVGGSVATMAGDTVQLRTEGMRDIGYAGYLSSWNGSTVHMVYDITFYEDTI